MSGRERKRAERRKRKHRNAAQQRTDIAQRADSAPLAGVGAPAANGSEPDTEAGIDLVSAAEEQSPSRSEIKNQAAREALDPLAEGERPGVVSAGAVVSAVISLSILVGYFAGVEVDPNGSGEAREPTALQAFPPAFLFAVMAWGMWRARYWAVLGFQAMMAIFMLVSFIGLIGATSTLNALGAAAVLLASALFFWFTVKALARIQMPTYPGDRR